MSDRQAGKGDKRRPGKGYGDNFDRIFGKDHKPTSSFQTFGEGGRGFVVGIIPDIEPFKSPITGEIISSRSQLRQHHKEHGTTDSRDYSPEFIEKRYKERSEKMMGMTKRDREHRTEALKEAVDKHLRR